MADPMYTDSLFIKSHPAYDTDAKDRTHGEHYIYWGTVNRKERMEMIYRSIGRQYDWDLEKYRVAFALNEDVE